MYGISLLLFVISKIIQISQNQKKEDNAQIELSISDKMQIFHVLSELEIIFIETFSNFLFNLIFSFSFIKFNFVGGFYCLLNKSKN